MSKNKVILYALADALGTLLYIAIAAFVITNGEKIFGKMSGFLGAFSFLTFFVVSATITFMLFFGAPINMYLEGLHKEARSVVLWSVLFIAIVSFLALSFLVLK